MFKKFTEDYISFLEEQVKGAGKKFKLTDSVTPNDLTEYLEQKELLKPDTKFLRAMDHYNSLLRAREVMKVSPSDYYEKHEKTVKAKTERSKEIADELDIAFKVDLT